MRCAGSGSVMMAVVLIAPSKVSVDARATLGERRRQVLTDGELPPCDGAAIAQKIALSGTSAAIRATAQEGRSAIETRGLRKGRELRDAYEQVRRTAGGASTAAAGTARTPRSISGSRHTWPSVNRRRLRCSQRQQAR